MKQQYLQTGKIVSTHGVRGEVKLLPWADSPEFLLQFDTLWIGGRACRVESSRVQKTCVLIKLAGIDTVEAASALRDQVVSIDRADAQLPQGSIFIADLLGLRRRNAHRQADRRHVHARQRRLCRKKCGRAGASDPRRAGIRPRTQCGRGLYPRAAHRRDVRPCALIS